MKQSGLQTRSTITDRNEFAGSPLEFWEQREQLLLASYAMFSSDSQGRKHEEEPHAYRGPFQRDRDRVLHCAAFRRLSGKMQVFTGDMGDYHRTRLTHTHEVATIARTIGRVLKLNEDLIEALALLHDIGHPPYGHSGEEALNRCLDQNGGFSHNSFALTLVEQLETRHTSFPGLNLTQEMLAGQDYRITHEGLSTLLEVQVVDLADSIAYNAHDVDDALTLGLLNLDQLERLDLVQRAQNRSGWKSPEKSQRALQQALVNTLIEVQVADLLKSAQAALAELKGLDSLAVQEVGVQLQLSTRVSSERQQLAEFLFENVYRHEKLLAVRKLAANRVEHLFDKLLSKPHLLPPRFAERAERVGLERAAGEYIAGMTDRFCDQRYHELIEWGHNVPRDW